VRSVFVPPAQALSAFGVSLKFSSQGLWI